jgi:superfamily II DNA or RNA helicase
VQALFEAIRQAALPGMWSKGVQLARERCVRLVRRTDDELELQVKQPRLAVSASVTLYLQELEWTCDCDSSQDPCQHVTAAAIALQRAAQAGEQLTKQEQVQSKLVYRFRMDGGWLALDRWLIAPDGTEFRLTGTIAGRLDRHGQHETFSPTQEDLAVDRLLQAMLHGDRLESRLPKLLVALADRDDVFFEAQPVRVSARLLLPRVRVFDREPDVVLRVEPAVELSGVVARGLALCTDELRPLGETDFTGPRLERLPLERVFRRAELGELVTEVLPELQRRFAVEVESHRLPGRSRGYPARIAFDLEQLDAGLSVLPTLVYGDPAAARIDAGRLVLLGKTTPERDPAEERRLISELRDALNLVPGQRVTVRGREAAQLADRIRRWAAQHGDEQSLRFFGDTPLVPRLVIDGDRFELNFGLAAEDQAEPPEACQARQVGVEAVIQAWREGLDLVPLDGGGWAPLPADWLRKFGHQIADLLTARDAAGRVATVALPMLAELCAALDHPPPPGLARLRPLLEGFQSIPTATLPSDLSATLREYQREGVNWLAFLREAGLGGVLADDMGLGKTLQALCVLHGKSLVVCPRSVLHNWAAEIRRFRPALRFEIYHGPQRALSEASVTLTTYALLRMDIDRLAAEAWDTVVLDEAQMIKNPDSQVARAAYRLGATFRISLSGTPVENRLEELWSQLHFTNPGLLGTRKDFEARYAHPIQAGVTVTAERLRQRTRPFVLRRLKREVARELPPRSDVKLEVELDEAERNTYDAVRAATRQEVVQRLRQGGSVLAALEALLRLRQAACHAGLLPGAQAESSSKMARLLLALEDAVANGHKALVFSQWTALLDLVEPELQDAGLSFVRLDGSTRDRAGVVAEFQSPAGPPVMLVSLKAGGTGLNLTAADHVFLLDPWWNPAAEEQAADRAHRIGQDRPVFVYRLVARNTVEEGILALQQHKRALAESALGEASRVATITREDLLRLLD